MQITRKVAARLSHLFVAEDGPSATEYAILLALLILVAVAAIGGIGSRVYNIYQNIDSTVSGAAGI